MCVHFLQDGRTNAGSDEPEQVTLDEIEFDAPLWLRFLAVVGITVAFALAIIGVLAVGARP